MSTRTFILIELGLLVLLILQAQVWQHVFDSHDVAMLVNVGFSVLLGSMMGSTSYIWWTERRYR